MIELDQVSYRYPGATAPALDRVSLNLRPGTVTALIGPNGSGKTTLVRHLNALLRPDRGRVLFDGHDIAGIGTATLAGRIAVIGQDPDVQLTQPRVRAEVGLGVRPRLRERIDPVLERCGLGDAGSLHPHELGRGARTWVLIAAALVRDPAVVVLDEPTAAMDAGQCDRLAGVLGDLAASGTTIVVASHDLDFVVDTCTDAAVLEAGRVRYHGPVRALTDPEGVLAELAQHVELADLSVACGLHPPAASLEDAVRRLARPKAP